MFKMRSVSTIKDVVDWGLCVGCGACVSVCQKDAVQLKQFDSIGIRPVFDTTKCENCTECLAYCPGIQVDGDIVTGRLPKKTPGSVEFGPTLEIWEGYAADPDLRFNGSSGGMISALSLYCLEHENMEAVIHTGMDPDIPWSNKTMHSFSRDDLLSRCGSRYAPASPCESLVDIEKGEGRCVFIGKPCDAAGATMLRKERTALDKNLGLILSFFCAGTPSTNATLDLLKQASIPLEAVASLRYRGQGWPGGFSVIRNDGGPEYKISYMESWGKINKYRPFRCQLCPDGLGRLSDITCGDAWHRKNEGDDPGRSIVLVRSERGREILDRARQAGYVVIERISDQDVLNAQPNLLIKRNWLFGRLLAMKILFIPTPRLKGFSLFSSWMRQSVATRFKTIAGTLRRLLTRGLWHPNPLS